MALIQANKNPLFSQKTISTILRHDRKVSSYKIALVRAINDVVIGFPDLRDGDQDIAVPLSLLAEFWLAYYWPFADPNHTIKQGAAGVSHNDISFRPELTRLRQQWDATSGIKPGPANGFLLRDEMRVPRRQHKLDPAIVVTYYAAVRKAIEALKMPIRHAGPGVTQWSIFPPPLRWKEASSAVAVPGTLPTDLCVLISASLWQVFREMSLWIDALCIHEWCLFTESIKQNRNNSIDRGHVYQLLTAKPDSRRPLTWERNYINILMQEGCIFQCPWTEKRITLGTPYDLDHLLPVAVYPINELWNLVPADHYFNSHIKRDRLPSAQYLAQAQPHLVRAYRHYDSQPDLSRTLANDVGLRFAGTAGNSANPQTIAQSVIDLLGEFAQQRNLPRFY